jgi:hypothetical protein
MKSATGVTVQQKLPAPGAVQVNEPGTGALPEMQRTTVSGDAGAVRAAGSPPASSRCGAFWSVDEMAVPAMDNPWEKAATDLGCKGKVPASDEPLKPPMNKDGNEGGEDHLSPPRMPIGHADFDEEPEVRSALHLLVSICMQYFTKGF